MRSSVEDKGCLNNNGRGAIAAQETNFEFHKGSTAKNIASSHHHHHHHHHRQMSLGKPTPLKWDDAQKWLGNHLSRNGHQKNHSSTKPRNSNADDRRLINNPVPKEEEYNTEDEDEDEDESGGGRHDIDNDDDLVIPYEGELTKKMDESIWRINKKTSAGSSSSGAVAAAPVVRSICVRDMGTEMTPVGSQEPSRTATPVKSTTPATRSPIASGSSTPARYQNGIIHIVETDDDRSNRAGNGGGTATTTTATTSRFGREGEEVNESRSSLDAAAKKPNPLETRAMAWDEAERAKYLARYKREEMKIQAWENHQKRKAEMSMRRMEVNNKL
ncbi:OLC1v1028719C2 [Oldenlandia corymbosa var. corymbosa]|uniref:OLC1v1028719C2 n=1 Tax=Oldenlandia corymbosa var. corymbosa TaxID=529605 RepID=A0AAV1CCL2_OLDCO|nr:OLC1v1028719C2 [Oldenlandia corymbosa var. corymbosa]